ncbi:MAG: hypothetical protein DRI95_07750 [Bacteroidetes bacterium]|nr:MAG: hypothetical protein DRI95_07750 [Bacteroidota bacterium]
MQQTIDINLIKESPSLFFSQLNKDAEDEFVYLLEYFIYKYGIKIDNKKEQMNAGNTISDLLPKKVKEFTPLNRDEIYAR